MQSPAPLKKNPLPVVKIGWGADGGGAVGSLRTGFLGGGTCAHVLTEKSSRRRLKVSAWRGRSGVPPKRGQGGEGGRGVDVGDNFCREGFSEQRRRARVRLFYDTGWPTRCRTRRFHSGSACRFFLRRIRSRLDRPADFRVAPFPRVSARPRQTVEKDRCKTAVRTL